MRKATYTAITQTMSDKCLNAPMDTSGPREKSIYAGAGGKMINKYLTATKVKNGYLVTITEAYLAHSKKDVLKLIKLEGLKICKKTSYKKEDKDGVFHERIDAKAK